MGKRGNVCPGRRFPVPRAQWCNGIGNVCPGRRTPVPHSQWSQLHTVELAPFRMTSPLTKFPPQAVVRGSPSPMLRLVETGGRSPLYAQSKTGTTIKVIPVLMWSIGESNPVSLHCVRSVRFAIVVCLLCRSTDSFAHQASASLHPPLAALRLRPSPMLRLVETGMRTLHVRINKTGYP